MLTFIGGMKVVKSPYGIFNGEEIYQYALSNDQGMEMRVINYGGIVTHLFVPDREGQSRDVILGLNDLPSYLGDHPFFGAIVGRFGNRIANGRFKIDGESYQLPVNNGPHCLHGGVETFSHKIWQIEPLTTATHTGLKLSMTSPHMDQGFPGTLKTEVYYLLDYENSWTIKYNAQSDLATVINLTQHAYFNLNGHENGHVLDHYLEIDADCYTPVDETMIPTGEIAEVDHTPFDFRESHKVGFKMDGGLDPMIENARGYDLNYVLNGENGIVRSVAEVSSHLSGIKMEVLTSEPGAQLYIGNWLDGIQGKDGAVYQPYHGLCIETQHYPDSPNQPSFPNTLLRPGKVYVSETRYKFSTI